MNLATLYSSTIGQPIDKIYTNEKYYPLPFDNYIVVQPWSKPAKNYDWMEEVITLILPYLEKEDIKLVQVGAKDEKPLRNCYYTQGTTNWGQLQYLISKAKLVLSIDSISSHLAGHYNIPLVVLISNNFKECVAPYFGDKSKQIILEPDRTKQNPSFMLDEGLIKQINSIKPEDVANSALKLLNIQFNINVKTLYQGYLYPQTEISLVPDQIVNPSFAQNMVFNVRADLGGTLENAFQQVSLAKSVLFLNKIVDIEILKQLKPNLLQIVLLKGAIDNLGFVKSVKKLGVPLCLVTEKEGQILNDMKLNFMDIGILQNFPKFPLEKANFLTKLPENAFVKSNRLFLSNSKVFASKEHLLAGIECQLQDTESKVINTKEFWENNLESVWVYTKE